MEDVHAEVKRIREKGERVYKAVTHIKEIITIEGFFGIPEFKALVASLQEGDEDALLGILGNEGIVYVKTFAVNPEVEQEVLVDIRPMAAAMLLIYGERGYAMKHSVFKYLQALYNMGEWAGALLLRYKGPLLEDMYGSYGHNFSVMEVADNANLSEEDATVIIKQAQRHSHTMRELMKSDAELTAVFQLAKRTMDIVNGNTINGHRASRADMVYRNFKNPVAYNRFWTVVQRIIDTHYKKPKSK